MADSPDGADLDADVRATGRRVTEQSPVRRLFAAKFAKEITALLVILLAVQFLFPRDIPLGIYGVGIVGGSSLALQAIGLILVYRSNRFVNFAQAAIGATAAGMFALSANYQPSARWLDNVCPPCVGEVGRSYYLVNYWVSFVLALGLSAGMGYLIYVLVVRRFEGSPRLVLTVATIFISTGLPGLLGRALQVMTTRGQRELGVVSSRAVMPFDFTIEISPAQFHATDVFTVLAAVGAVIGLAVYFRFSPVGIAIRASADNSARAETLGVSVVTVTSRVWLIVGLLSGVAALLSTMSISGASTGQSTGDFVLVLAVVVVARMTSLPMAAFAALVFGILNQATRWAFGSSVLLDGSLVVVIGGILLLQRYRSSRAEIERAGGWQATKEIRPIPAELRSLPVVKKWLRVFGVLAVVVVGTYPWVMSPTQTNLASVVMIYAMVGLSLLILTGWAGQISLGQFAFCGIGAYVAAAFDLPFVVALVAAALVGAAIAVVVGLPALKLRGLHLAISTLAFAVATSAVLLNPRYLGKRLPTTLDRPAVLGMDLDDQRTFYYLTLLVLVLVAVAVAGLRGSRTARVLIAARDNEQTVQSFGVNVVRARLTAFALSGFFAALAGALYAYHQHGVEANAFGPEQSLHIFLLTVIGGLGSIAGPLLGALYQGTLFVFGATPVVSQLATGFGGLFLLLAIPGGLAKLVADVRDAALRRVASRNRIVVASLVADRKASDVDNRAQIAPRQRQGGGTAFVPTRYAVDRQWALDLTDSIVDAGAVDTSASTEGGEADRDGFTGLSEASVGADGEGRTV